jgi:hypothetical protein
MIPHARRLVVLLTPLVLLAACGSSGQQRTAQSLDDRLLAQMRPDIAAGNVVLQPLPDGAQVTLLGTSQFPNGVKAFDDQQPDVRSAVIEGLLDPSLMQIQVADTSTLPDDQRNTRILNVARYFEAYGLEQTLQPTVPPQAVSPPPATAAPPGLTITIRVQCPRYHDGAGYGDGTSKPVCD